MRWHPTTINTHAHKNAQPITDQRMYQKFDVSSIIVSFASELNYSRQEVRFVQDCSADLGCEVIQLSVLDFLATPKVDSIVAAPNVFRKNAMPSSNETELENLRNEIRAHDQLYYVEANPKITDLEYDRLMDRLKAIENEHPELITPDSPTQRVGEQPVEHLEQFEHRVPMLSIDNTYSIEELEKFGERVSGLLNGEPIEWVVELKIDGVAATVIYENGVLTRALTRGNGTIGDDITHNIRTLQDIPLKLSTPNPPTVFEGSWRSLHE